MAKQQKVLKGWAMIPASGIGCYQFFETRAAARRAKLVDPYGYRWVAIRRVTITVES